MILLTMIWMLSNKGNLFVRRFLLFDESVLLVMRHEWMLQVQSLTAIYLSQTSSGAVAIFNVASQPTWTALWSFWQCWNLSWARLGLENAIWYAEGLTFLKWSWAELAVFTMPPLTTSLPWRARAQAVHATGLKPVSDWCPASCSFNSCQWGVHCPGTSRWLWCSCWACLRVPEQEAQHRDFQ